MGRQGCSKLKRAAVCAAKDGNTVHAGNSPWYEQIVASG
jgi:hypothetical protein